MDTNFSKDELIQLIDQEISNNFAKKIGDTPTDALQLTPRKYVDSQITGISSTITASVAAAIAGITVSSGLWGDGSDSGASFDGTNQPLGSSIVSTGNYQLIRDVFYSSVIVSNTNLVRTNSYRMFVQGILQIQTGSQIHHNGYTGARGFDGGAPAGGPGGLGSSVISSGTLPGSSGGTPGGSGGNGNNNGNGQNGNLNVPTSVLHGWGSPGATHGSNKGGNGGTAGARTPGSGATESSGGSLIAAKILPHSTQAVFGLSDYTPDGTGLSLVQSFVQTSANGVASGPGGGGASDGINTTSGGGAGSGDGGGTGGMIVIFAKIIDNNTSTGIQSKGGDAGPGGNGGAATTTGGGAQGGGGGGGQGGSGGTGGVVVLVTSSIIGTGTVDVSGGIGAAGGSAGAAINGGGPAQAGQSGSTGASGKIYTIYV